MSASVDSVASSSPSGSSPDLECDVVMRGGTTSGIVYPRALAEIAKKYRLRGVGGTSAGAIGAAFAAAAEFGRSSESGGFELLEDLPNQMGEGQLAALFHPQKETAPMLRLVLAFTGNDRPGPKRGMGSRAAATAGALVKGWPAALLGALPGAALLVVGLMNAASITGWLLAVTGLVLVAVGWSIGLLLAVLRTLTRSVPENQFGLCRGRGRDEEHPGLTDWLARNIDDLAGLEATNRPLRFGQLWTHEANPSSPTRERPIIDLRTVTTSISEGRAYEMPWDAQYFFYDPSVWSTLFPDEVMDALRQAPALRPQDEEWMWENEIASVHEPPLLRLPEAANLPIIVAIRLSLSLPLIVSAVPLWTIDRASEATTRAVREHRAARRNNRPEQVADLSFRKVWFTDGGMVSAFPLHMFDAALPTRPTFAIDLGHMSASRHRSVQEENLRFTSGNEKLPPIIRQIPDSGIKAIANFASAAMAASRDWNDSSHLSFPGYRDRIVQVLQTSHEGGLNLHMDSETINNLADRGRAAGEVLVNKFTAGQEEFGGFTGWDNHRWLRYRALLSCLPSFLEEWQRGRTELGADLVAAPPSYPFPSRASQALADDLSTALDRAAEIVCQIPTTAGSPALDALTREPNPSGVIRRRPPM